MSEYWIEVQPGGYLKKYGNHRFYVSKPAEAIKAMLMQVEGFEKAFKAADKRGVKFAIKTDNRELTNLEQLHMGKPKVLRIIPLYKGSKSGGGAFLGIAVVIAATVLTAGAAGFGAGAWLAAGSTSASIATTVAVSFALGGITQLLAPKAQGLSTRSDAENESSYAFGGAVNTTAQGTPLAYFAGEREVGGAVISVSIRSEDQQ